MQPSNNLVAKSPKNSNAPVSFEAVKLVSRNEKPETLKATNSKELQMMQEEPAMRVLKRGPITKSYQSLNFANKQPIFPPIENQRASINKPEIFGSEILPEIKPLP